MWILNYEAKQYVYLQLAVCTTSHLHIIKIAIVDYVF